MENKEEETVLEISQEELDRIAAGYVPDRPPMKQMMQPIGEIKCANCGGNIPVSAYNILYSGCLFCPHCGLKMNIDKRKSKKTLQILAKVDEALSRAQNKK